MSASDLLTIGELAEFVGVTVRAIRHYHSRGLLPEPERDTSGYRRYDALAVVDLVRIRALAEAGVPLSRVAELLDVDSEEFAAETAAIDARLRREIRRLQEHRRRVAGLASGERLVLPDIVIAYLDRLRELDFSDRYVELERDGWILISARSPERIEEWMTDKIADLDEPRHLATYRMLDRCRGWDPADPRLEEAADFFDGILSAMADEWEQAYAAGRDRADDEVEPTVASLLDDRMMVESPAWARLTQLLEKRGWRGWSNISRVE